MRLLNEVRILSMTGLMNSRDDSRLFLLYWGMNVQQRGGMASSGAEIAAFRKRLNLISVNDSQDTGYRTAHSPRNSQWNSASD